MTTPNTDARTNPKTTKATESPEAFLLRMNAKEPEALAERQFDYLASLAPKSVLLQAAARYFSLIHRRVVFPATVAARQGTIAQRALREAHRDSLAGAAIKRVLGLMTINGKAIGDCRKRDLKAQAGWLTELAGKLNHVQRVRDVFTDAEVFAIYQRHTGKK